MQDYDNVIPWYAGGGSWKPFHGVNVTSHPSSESQPEVLPCAVITEVNYGFLHLGLVKVAALLLKMLL